MNNAVLPNATGGTHWLTYLPGCMYCFLPSFEADKGTVYVYDHIPDFLLDFLYCTEILNITDGGKTTEHGNKAYQGNDFKSNLGKINDSNNFKHGKIMDGTKSSQGWMSKNNSKKIYQIQTK